MRNEFPKISAKISRLMSKFNYSIKDLAQEADVSYSAVKKVVAGRHGLSPKMAVRMAEVFEIEPIALLKLDCEDRINQVLEYDN